MHSILFWRPALLILLFIMFPISTHPFNLDSCPSAKAWSFTARHVYMSTQTFIWIQTLHGITHEKETFYRVQCHIKASVTHKKRHFKQFEDKKILIVFFLEKEYVMCYVMLSVLCYKIYKTITTILLLLLVVVVVVLLLFILLIYHYSYWIAFIVLTFKLSSY